MISIQKAAIQVKKAALRRNKKNSMKKEEQRHVEPNDMMFCYRYF